MTGWARIMYERQELKVYFDPVVPFPSLLFSFHYELFLTFSPALGFSPDANACPNFSCFLIVCHDHKEMIGGMYASVQ
jgi:hypothetical protein